MVKLVTLMLTLSALALNFQQQLSSSITIEWTVENESIYLCFKCKITKGYCAIGFKRRMLDTDMIIIKNTGHYVLYDDHYSTSHYTPLKDTEQGGNNDLEFIDGGIDINGYIDITVKRNLNTGDKYDEIIPVDKSIEICWASKDDTESLTLHEDCGSGSIVFATASIFLDFKKFGVPSETVEHINLMCTFWSIVTVIGAISARYFKWTSWWSYVHFLSFTLVIIVTVISSSKQYKYDKVFLETMEDMQLISKTIGNNNIMIFI
ncbi:hypothetical protein SteCoe_39614 [Stentor coeruleus]|uniref:DOMON domain-containing protein n=1 Tax=Stentor coeruleus TaxID=5963 RepID=A0A1R2AKK2_9CILI|nr:hypothetical protein SteCoe_39614 [Stentor coeruleus]